MTRYDEPGAGDGNGGPHPLAGIPQEVLDAATAALAAADRSRTGELRIDAEDVEPVAHAVLLAAVDALRAAPTRVTFVLWDGETDGVAVLHDGEQVWAESSFDDLGQYLRHHAPLGVPVVLDHEVRD